MRRSIVMLASALLVTGMLSGCLIVPAWDDGGYGGGGYGGYYGGYGGGYHHHGYHHGYGHW